jgi:hypothetical protein
LPAVVSNLDSRDVVLKCLSSGAADYWVRPLRTNEVEMLWTRVWRPQVGAVLRISYPVEGLAGIVGILRRMQVALPFDQPTAQQPRVVAIEICDQRDTYPLSCPQAAAQQPAADDSGSGNSSDAAAK